MFVNSIVADIAGWLRLLKCALIRLSCDNRDLKHPHSIAPRAAINMPLTIDALREPSPETDLLAWFNHLSVATGLDGWALLGRTIKERSGTSTCGGLYYELDAEINHAVAACGLLGLA